MNYSSFSLSKITPGIELPADLYLFVSGHFLKFKMVGDVISREKYDLFICKGIEFVFVSSVDLEAYEAWALRNINDEKDALISNVGIEHLDIVEAQLELKDQFITFIHKEVTDESVKQMVNKTRDLVSKVTAKRLTENFMSKMVTHSRSLVDHATNVANLSTYLALNIGYAQQIILENIYLGALLHDFGKTKMDPKFLDDPTTKNYHTIVNKHPTIGKTALLIDSSFPEEVLRIVAEHHENHNGTGYPKGLKGTRIYELTKIVTIANIYDNLMSTSSGNFSERNQKVLRAMQREDGKVFDPKIFAKAHKALSALA